MECDWIIAQTGCAACDGTGRFGLLKPGEFRPAVPVGMTCVFCNGTGILEYEGPDDDLLRT